MPYNYSDIEKRLLKLWFKNVRQNWSHVIFSDWKTSFPVPKHGNKDISIWVENKIIKNIGFTKEDFKNILK